VGTVVLPSQEFGKFHAIVSDTPVSEATATLVEFTLSPAGDGTRVQLVESGFSGTDALKVDQARHAEANSQGWRQMLDNLRRYGERRAA
jgi:uncharacterized protein YndB with AHSA1/START domain